MRKIFEFLLLACLWAASAEAADRPMRIVVFGDSLTSGYQMAPEDAFPVKLERKLRLSGYQTEVINMSIPGETTANGLARVDTVLAKSPDIVIVEFGINDAMRGIDPKIINSNLYRLVFQLKYDETGADRGIYLLLAGVKSPPEMGYDYGARFQQVFTNVASELSISLYPLVLEGVTGEPRFNLADGMHPNGLGVEVMVENMFPYIKHLLDYHKYADEVNAYRKQYMDRQKQWSPPAQQ